MSPYTNPDSYPLLVLEGPDGSGKSTFIKNLSLSHRIFRVSSFGVLGQKRNNVFDLENWLAHLDFTVTEAAKTKTIVALDRFTPVSERVYAPIFRSMASYNYQAKRLFNIESDYFCPGPLFIQMNPPVEVCQTNVRNDPSESELIKYYIKTIHARYLNVMDGYRSNFPDSQILEYDYTTQNLNHLIERMPYEWKVVFEKAAL